MNNNRLKYATYRFEKDVYEYAKEKALAVGMAEKAKEFLATGSEIYYGNLPDGAK